MADTKISALTAVVTPATTDEFAVNQAGTSKKMTLAQIETYVGAKLTSSGAAPATGEANQNAAPSRTLVLNTANNAVTTIETVLQVTSVPAGTYFFEYYLVWRAGATTTGALFSLDCTGTMTRIRITRHYQSTGTTAATGVSDGASATLTGQLVEHMSSVVDGGSLGPNTGVASTTEDQFDHIRGIVVLGTTGDLNMRLTGEGNAAVTFMADSFVQLERLA